MRVIIKVERGGNMTYTPIAIHGLSTLYNDAHEPIETVFLLDSRKYTINYLDDDEYMIVIDDNLDDFLREQVCDFMQQLRRIIIHVSKLKKYYDMHETPFIELMQMLRDITLKNRRAVDFLKYKKHLSTYYNLYIKNQFIP
jgi:hypothetical protein